MFRYKEYIYAVYRERSFSKAAEKLFVSQPALSSAIKKAENTIGLPLFDRNTTPIQLTSAGEYYIRCIERVMEIEREAQAQFQAMSGKTNGALSIGSSAYFCAHVLPSLLIEFGRLHPEYTLDLVEANVSQLRASLQEGKLDFIIDVEPLVLTQFASKVLAQETILLAVPNGYMINETLCTFRLTFEQVKSGEYHKAKHLPVDMGQFREQPFVFLKKGNDSYKRGMKICASAGFEPQISMYVDQLLTSYYIACSGKGVAFIRAGITQYVEPTDKLFFYKINDALATRNIMLYYKKTALLDKASAGFVTFLEQRKRSGQFI